MAQSKLTADNVITYCTFTLSEVLTNQDSEFYQEIINLGFKIVGMTPFVIETNSLSLKKLVKFSQFIDKWLDNVENNKLESRKYSSSSRGFASLSNEKEYVKTSLDDEDEPYGDGDSEKKRKQEMKASLEKNSSDSEKRYTQRDRDTATGRRLPSRTEDSLSSSSSDDDDDNDVTLGAVGGGLGSKKSSTSHSETIKRSVIAKSGHSVYIAGSKTFRVDVGKGDITRLKVDAIVNAANSRLDHLGGISRAIAKAAGRELERECERHIISQKSQEVTTNFVSTAGLLAPDIKKVIHAVGPMWEMYSASKKGKCAVDLKKTVLNCLLEAAKLRMTSIALPSISAAIFKVPKVICALCYVEAVKQFDEISEEENMSVEKIYFVDVKDDMVSIISDHFSKKWIGPRLDDEDLEKVCLSLSESLPPRSHGISHQRTQIPPGIRPGSTASGIERQRLDERYSTSSSTMSVPRTSLGPYPGFDVTRSRGTGTGISRPYQSSYK